MEKCPDCGLPVYRHDAPNWAPAPTCQAHVSDKLLIGCRDRQRKQQAARITELEAALAEEKLKGEALEQAWQNEIRCSAQIQRGQQERLAERDRRVAELDMRRREGRKLLARMVKYCREDKATTERATRLERLVTQVAGYLNRTHKPSDILRSDELPPTPSE